MHGLLDSIDLLAPAARELVLVLAANWPHRKLREAATALRQPPEPAQTSAATAAQKPKSRTEAQPSLF